jgi:hypothetical protein
MDRIKAIVEKVVSDGPHGPFAIATSDSFDGESITFSLEPTVWLNKDWPEGGSVVLLWKLRQKRAGWRAKAGRFFKPSDEQTAERKVVMSTQTSTHDWTKTDLGHWSVKMDLETAASHLAFSAGIMRYFSKEGRALLESDQFLDALEWRELLEKVYYLLRDFGGKTVDYIFLKVVERGIRDLTKYVQEDGDNQIAHEWWCNLHYQLQAGCRLGIGSKNTLGDEVSRKIMDEMMLPLAKMLGKHYLESLATSRFYHDEAAQASFVKEHSPTTKSEDQFKEMIAGVKLSDQEEDILREDVGLSPKGKTEKVPVLRKRLQMRAWAKLNQNGEKPS